MMTVSDNSAKFRKNVDLPGIVSNPRNSRKFGSPLSRCINSVVVSILKKHFVQTFHIKGW
jgi:hypothetical protein